MFRHVASAALLLGSLACAEGSGARGEAASRTFDYAAARCIITDVGSDHLRVPCTFRLELPDEGREGGVRIVYRANGVERSIFEARTQAELKHWVGEAASFVARPTSSTDDVHGPGTEVGEHGHTVVVWTNNSGGHIWFYFGNERTGRILFDSSEASAVLAYFRETAQKM